MQLQNDVSTREEELYHILLAQEAIFPLPAGHGYCLSALKILVP